MLFVPGKRPLKEALVLKVIEKVSLLSSREEAMVLIETLRKKLKPVVLSFINAHCYNLCCTNPDFSRALINSDVILRDGIGMQFLFSSIGKAPGANLNGTDLIPEMVEQFKGQKVALLGTEASYLKKAAEKLTAEGHTVILTETGFHTEDHYLDLVNDAKPDVVILGMGMPKQEQVSILLKENLEHGCLIINGGAILDFWGGKVRRAPMWLRRMKLEWFFRLAQEPKRLFSRYVTGNYIFLKRTRELKRHLMATAQPLIINYADMEEVDTTIVMHQPVELQKERV